MTCVWRQCRFASVLSQISTTANILFLEKHNEAAQKKDGLSEEQCCLELVLQQRLFGIVEDMATIRLPNTESGASDMDALALTFADAKVLRNCDIWSILNVRHAKRHSAYRFTQLSLVEFCPASNSIATVSLHYYEREEFKTDTMAVTTRPFLRLDPDQKCLLMRCYTDHIAVLPIAQSAWSFDMSEPSTLDSSNPYASDTNMDGNEAKRPYLSSFVLDPASIYPRLRNIRDFVVLPGYYQATVAILYEPTETWIG